MARSAGRGSGQGGYALAAALIFMVVLVMVGSVSMLKVRGELRHTTRDILQTKAQAVAESAVNWAISALSQDRPGVLAYTAATHANDGVQPLADYLQNNEINPRKLHAWDVAGVYGGAAAIDRDGWIFQRTLSPAASLTRSREEVIAFRVWFPNDSTIRVTGRGEVQGVQAQVEMTGKLVYRAIGI